MRILYNKETLEIAMIDHDDQSFAYTPLAVIQADENTAIRIAIAIGLDASKIIKYAEENNITLNMSQELQTVLKKRAIGHNIVNRFLAENESMEISTVDNITQLSVFMEAKMMLESGALQSALDIIQQIPETSFILTPPYSTQGERKQSYIDELTLIISDLLAP